MVGMILLEKLQRSAVKKKRKERQEAQIDLDFSDVERAIDEYYERNNLQ